MEHERRLVQATDALLAGIAPARPRPAPPATDAPLAAVPPWTPTPTPEDEALTEAARRARCTAAAAAAPTSEQIAAAAEVLVTARTRRQLAAAVTWNAMIAIAVILTVASIVLIVAGALGVSQRFIARRANLGSGAQQALDRRRHRLEPRLVRGRVRVDDLHRHVPGL